MVKNCSIKNVYVFCMDGIKELLEAINSTFTNYVIQLLIIHQIRSSIKCVSFKDLKRAYPSVIKGKVVKGFINFKDKWQNSYPSCVKSWEKNCAILTTSFCIFYGNIKDNIYD